MRRAGTHPSSVTVDLAGGESERAALDAEAASAPIDNDTAPPPRYYGDAELAAALDRDLAAAWGGHSKPLRAPVRAPRSI